MSEIIYDAQHRDLRSEVDLSQVRLLPGKEMKEKAHFHSDFSTGLIDGYEGENPVAVMAMSRGDLALYTSYTPETLRDVANGMLRMADVLEEQIALAEAKKASKQ